MPTQPRKKYDSKEILTRLFSLAVLVGGLTCMAVSLVIYPQLPILFKTFLTGVGFVLLVISAIVWKMANMIFEGGSEMTPNPVLLRAFNYDYTHRTTEVRRIGRISVTIPCPMFSEINGPPTCLAPPPPTYDQSETTAASTAPPPYTMNSVVVRTSTSSPPPSYNNGMAINSPPPSPPRPQRARDAHVVIDCSKAEPMVVQYSGQESVI